MESKVHTLKADSTREGSPDAPRQSWMSLLARAPLDLLEAARAHLAGPAQQWLRAPETGVLMRQGRAGGTGLRFNLGEATVTRCALRTDPHLVACGAVGVAYVLGRSHRHVELAATADALLQDPACCDRLPPDLLAQIAMWLGAQRAAQRARAQATRVEFFTLARETGGVGAEAERGE